MGEPNFMTRDVTGTLVAFGAFPLFLVVPGYVLGAITNILDFRRRGFAAKGALSLALAIAVCPIVTYLLARSAGFPLVWGAYATTWGIGCALLGMHLVTAGPCIWSWSLWRDRRLRIALLVSVVWVTLALVSLVDFQIGNRLYVSVTSYDYTARVAVTDAILRTGLPPLNPSFFPGHPVTLYYYYFWFLLCSLVSQLVGPFAETRQVVFASTMWAGLGLIAVVALFLRFFHEEEAQPRVDARVLVGIGLLLVSGLDIIPVMIGNVASYLAGDRSLYPTVEWWNNQITGWFDAMLWVPHHIAGLTACLVGTLLILRAPAAESRRASATLLVTGALACASGLGLSIWVAVVFAVFLASWLVRCVFTRRFSEAAQVAGMGIIAAALCFPLLAELRQATSLERVPIAPTVRTFQPVKDQLDAAAEAGLGFVRPLVSGLLLPLNYLLEFGFFLLATALYLSWRLRTGRALNRYEQAGLLMLLTSFLVATFLRSDIGNNDLGWRAPMLGQFVMLLWSVEVVLAFGRWVAPQAGGAMATTVRIGRASRMALGAFLVLGVMTVVYDIVMLRVFPLLADAQLTASPSWLGTEGVSSNGDVGRRAYALREAYEWARMEVPPDLVVQHNPDTEIEIFHGLYGGHQTAAADWHHGMLYGIPDQAYRPVSDLVAGIFEDPESTPSDVDAICRQLSIGLVVVKDTDPAWNGSWVASKAPAFRNTFAEALPCGDETQVGARLVKRTS